MIRELVGGDAAAATTLWESVALTRPWNDPVADFDRALAGPTSTVLGEFEGDELIGTAMVGFDGHRGWIYYMAVARQRQGEGIGARLLEASELWLHGRGATKVQLMVRRSNESVIGFYESAGYADGEVVVLAKWIAGPEHV